MYHYNPFTELKPFRARSYKTSFWGKIKDTFFVFNGNEGKNINHVGIFDYVTLGVFALLSYASAAFFPEKTEIHPTRAWIAFVLFILSLLPRVLIAAAFTLSCLPIIALAHVLSIVKGQRIKENIRSCQIPKEEYELSVLNSATPTNKTVPGDSFLLEEDNNKLFYVNAANQKKEIEVLPSFKWAVKGENASTDAAESQIVAKLTPAPSSITYELIKKHLRNPNTPLLRSNHSVGELLKSKNVALEEVNRCTFTQSQDREELQLSLEKDWREVKLFLSSKNPRDRSLFQNIRELNIGEIEEAIEQNSSQEIIAPFLTA